ncbi:MAG: hypothetical protein HOD92_25865 [Deltaproteobacteria bacterium]|nr:hypothetical protein [Deltaproteobacteria bacterium]
MLTTAVIIYLNLPIVMASPIETIPRVMLYLAFPISIFVSMLGIVVAELFNWSGFLTKSGKTASYEPAMI